MQSRVCPVLQVYERDNFADAIMAATCSPLLMRAGDSRVNDDVECVRFLSQGPANTFYPWILLLAIRFLYTNRSPESLSCRVQQGFQDSKTHQFESCGYKSKVGNLEVWILDLAKFLHWLYHQKTMGRMVEVEGTFFTSTS